MSSNTTSIVINVRYGGFGLSTKATRRYLELSNIPFVESVDNYSKVMFIVNGKEYTFPQYKLELRCDPDLVQVVEELGEEVNGSCANLKIEKLEKGTLYRIVEYDGCERIELLSSIKWLTA